MNFEVSALQKAINKHKRDALELEKQIRSYLAAVVRGLQERWDEFSAGDVTVNGLPLGTIVDTNAMKILNKKGPMLSFEFRLAVGDFAVVSGASITVGNQGTVTLQVTGGQTVSANQSLLDPRFPGDNDSASVAGQITAVIQKALNQPGQQGPFLAMVRLEDLD